MSEVVITGMGIVSPIGIGLDNFWNSLLKKSSGARFSDHYSLDTVSQIKGLPFPITADIPNFTASRLKQWKILKKNQKVMSRDIQLGIEAADEAREMSELTEKPVNPERQGILFGAMMIMPDLTELVDAFRSCMDEQNQFIMSNMGYGFNLMQPLWMLKYLPNMTACHIGIAYDLRGPSNTLVNGETSGISAMLEAARVIQRGQADLMYTGGTSCCTSPTTWVKYEIYGISKETEHPEKAVRPFDIHRSGIIFGEGAASCILESRESAKQRNVKILGSILSWAETTEPAWEHHKNLQNKDEKICLQPEMFTGKSIENAIYLAMTRAGISKNDLAFVMASGYGTAHGDKVEAEAIHRTLGDIPVTAIKGATGYSLAGSGNMNIVATMHALRKGLIPPATNCEEIAPECPISVVTQNPIPTDKRTALVINYNFYGQVSVVILKREEE